MNAEEAARLKNGSAKEFAYWGVMDFAYIRRVVFDGKPAMAVHAANGTRLAVLGSLEDAQMSVLENDLEPLSVH